MELQPLCDDVAPVGSDWQLGGFAPTAANGFIGNLGGPLASGPQPSAGSTSQLVQAMAGFGGGAAAQQMTESRLGQCRHVTDLSDDTARLSRRLPSLIRDAGRRKPSSQPGLSQFRTIQVYPIDLTTALAAGCLSGSHLLLKGREFYRVA
jgi:hypothetical protein